MCIHSIWSGVSRKEDMSISERSCKISFALALEVDQINEYFLKRKYIFRSWKL